MPDLPMMRRAQPPNEQQEPAVEQRGNVWRVRSYAVAKQILQARGHTRQAGFTAEAIPRGVFRHHPILISDGPLHDEQRRKVGHFFAPKVVQDRYTGDMRRFAAALLDRSERDGACRVDDLALRYSVAVTRKAVGLDHSSVSGMARRLESFFRQPPFDIAAPGLGRTRTQWAQAAWNGLVPIARFYLADVRPAVRHLRNRPGNNVISHLIAEGYSNIDILVECVTYGTAGMVTTREFITMACWHLLDNAALRERYLAGDQTQRFAVLEEIIRLEPVVGHLYRRIQQPLSVAHQGETYVFKPGDLIDIQVRHTNTDTRAVGDNPLSLCPERPMTKGVDAAGLTFSAGAHQCPGRALAITETDVFLTDLLARNPSIVAAPTLGWDNLVSGYTLRGMTLAFPPSAS
ncbi:MAG TPA: cytochrome P450 [Mycobacterium sp.]